VFYSNRAACTRHFSEITFNNAEYSFIGYLNMQPPNYELIVQDCDQAVALDRNYVKAINRRAVALECLERYEESLRGYVSITSRSRMNIDVVNRLHYCYNPGQIPK
jgi:hypothetical protein